MKLTDTTRRILRVAFYAGYFLFAFVTFAYCTFPYDRVRDRIEQAVEQSMPGAQLDIVELAPSWITGVELTGVRLQLPSEETEELAPELVLSSVHARVGLLAWLGGRTSLSYAAELGGGGTIEGTFDESEEATHVEAHLADVALGRIGPLRRAARLPVAGTLGGDVDLTIAENVDQTTGSVVLTVHELALGDGRARLEIPGMRSGVLIEQLNAGDVNLRIEVEHGVGRIQQFASSSDDLELRGAGTLRLLRPVRMSNIDLLMRFEVKQPYRERNDRTRAIFSLVEMTPAARPFRTVDGAFQIRLSGSFGGVLRTQPAGNAAMPR